MPTVASKIDGFYGTKVFIYILVKSCSKEVDE